MLFMLDRVIAFIRNYQNLQDAAITGESQLVCDLGLTSFDMIEMCCQLEEDFGIIVNEEKIGSIVTVNDLVQFLEESRQEGSQ